MALNPLPTITGTQRKVTATLTSSTGPIAVTFPVFGTGSDLVVRLDGEDQVGNWTFTSPSGSVATIPKPITDGRVTFNSPVSGVVDVIGRRIPRRQVNLPENAGPTVRDFNFWALQTEATLSEIFYNGAADGGGGGAPAVDSFSATGVTTYTLSEEPIAGNIAVYVSGVYQVQASYSVSGTTLTFTEAPPAGVPIEVWINFGGGGISGGGGSTGPITSGDVTDFDEAVTDLIGAKVKAGVGIGVAFNDATGETTITNIASGGTGGGPIAAAAVSFTPAGGMTATDVQAAILEVNSTKAALTHNHNSSAIADFSEAVDDRVAALLQAGSGVTLSYNDAAGSLTITATGGGSSSFVTPESFGAVGDGVADDTAFVTSALRSQLPCLLVGYYRITSNISFGTAYTPLGKLVMGQGKKHFLLDAAAAGLTWTATTPDVYQNNMLVARDFTMMCNAVGTGAALSVETTAGSGSTNKTFDLRNIMTFGTTPSTGSLYGIRLVNQRNGVIDGCVHQGLRGGTAGAMTGSGIHCTGTGDPVDFNIVNCHAYFCNSGVYISGTHEGITIDKCIFVATDFGVYSELDENPISGDNEGKPLLKVTNCHSNNTIGGVFCVRTRDFYIAGNDFLTWQANSNWIGVQATTGGAASQYGYIGGNKFQDAFGVSSGNTTGIRLNGVATGGLFTIVGENRYVTLKRGLVLESNARYVQYSTGSIYAGCTTNILDTGSLNTAYGGGGGGGGGMTDAQLLSRANHTGAEPYATMFGKSSGSQGGALVLQKPDSSSLSADVVFDVSNGTFRVFENGGSTRGASLDLASQGSVGTTAIITSVNQGVYAAANAFNAIGQFALLIQADSFGPAGGTVSGANLYYAHTAGYGGIVGVGSWRRHGETSAAGQVTLFQRIA